MGTSVIKLRLEQTWAPSRRKEQTCLTQDMDSAEILDDFFASVFTGNCSNITTKATEGKGRDRENEKLPSIGEDRV